MDKENSSISKRWLIASGVAVILLTLLVFMSFPDPDVSMNRYYSWLMNVLILSVTGVMYVALFVLWVFLCFLYIRYKNEMSIPE
ncbi:hypothetical protein [Escherichia coli]|uniref:hypothetical protein n=1 Tax=Escherichia coli TaxID=562 RepID=UPI0020236858|nr:hypothetical protein [Escherichia coli]